MEASTTKLRSLLLTFLLLITTAIASPTLACDECRKPPKAPKPSHPPKAKAPAHPPKSRVPCPPVYGPPHGHVPRPPVVGPPKGHLPRTPVVSPPKGNAPHTPVVGPPKGHVPRPPVYGPPKGPIPRPPVTGSSRRRPAVLPKGSSVVTCPVDSLKIGACVDLLGGLVHVGLGDPVVNKCCPLLEGLVELEAAVCLCTTIRLKLLNINLVLPLALQLLLTCGKTPPTGYTCSI
uniref:36.4 kDa proline-rich protein n=1 Tax=Aegilops tauschii TaxID=37682 RepID=M8B9A0_AEGTA